MTLFALRLLERAHGHLGWLAVAALLHPAILLRRESRRARLSVSLATAIVVAVGACGAAVYPAYRDRIKQSIFIDEPRVGWLFERKEHLAVGAIAFALVGCLVHLTLPPAGAETDDRVRRTMARVAHRAFVVAFALALLTAVLGVGVASFRTF